MVNEPADSTKPPSARAAVRAFLDTEFIGQDGDVSFISVGLVTDKGDEFYSEMLAAEVDKLLAEHPSDFVRSTVLPQFGVVQGAPWSELPAHLASWLDSLGADTVEVVYDFSSDFVLIEQMQALQNRPTSVLLIPVHVGYLIGDPDGQAAADACWRAVASSKGVHRHHALADSYALRARFETVHPYVAERVEPKVIEVVATVSLLIPEFELVHAETEDGLTLSIGGGVEGVEWQMLEVGQRLKCVAVVGNSSRVLRAEVVR